MRYEIYIDKALRYTFFTLELFEDKLKELESKVVEYPHFKITTRSILLN